MIALQNMTARSSRSSSGGVGGVPSPAIRPSSRDVKTSLRAWSNPTVYERRRASAGGNRTGGGTSIPVESIRNDAGIIMCGEAGRRPPSTEPPSRDCTPMPESDMSMLHGVLSCFRFTSACAAMVRFRSRGRNACCLPRSGPSHPESWDRVLQRM